MAKMSAGLLLFRVQDDDVLEVFIVHPGGPFWAKKDAGSWSIPKGEYEVGEDPHSVARREFQEELGADPVLVGDELALGEIKQPSGKVVTVWASEGEFDATTAVSNTFEMEWPKSSGKMQSFPEVDRAAWFAAAEARSKLLSGHVGFIDRLVTELQAQGRRFNEGVSSLTEQTGLF
jgi:predicted NUDIX family NTP pyrophosphohydrolase